MKKHGTLFGAMLMAVAGMLISTAQPVEAAKTVTYTATDSTGSLAINGVNGANFTVDARIGDCFERVGIVFLASGCAPIQISCTTTLANESSLVSIVVHGGGNNTYDLTGDFPVGTSMIDCSVTESASCGDTTLTAKTSFTVTVQDKQPPVVTTPINHVQATDHGRCDAIVNYSQQVSVADNCPGAGCNTCGGPTVGCNPPSGTTFPIGTTPVHCVGRDASNNTDEQDFNVVIVDQEAPVIHTLDANGDPISVFCVPSSVPPGATGDDDDDDDTGHGGHGHTVRDCNGGCDYRPPPMTDNCLLSNGSYTNFNPVCDPPPGTVFPTGCTRVFCTNNFDAAGNQVENEAGQPPSFFVCTVNPVEVRFDSPLHNFGLSPRKDHEDKTVTTFKPGDKINAKVDLFDCGTHQLKAAAVAGYTALLDVTERVGTYSNSVAIVELAPANATYGDFGFVMMPAGDDLVYTLNTTGYEKDTATNSVKFFQVKVTVRPKNTPQVVVGTAYAIMESKH